MSRADHRGAVQQALALRRRYRNCTWRERQRHRIMETLWRHYGRYERCVVVDRSLLMPSGGGWLGERVPVRYGGDL